jgi:hypothetical protein
MVRAARPATSGRPLIPFLETDRLEGLAGAERPRPDTTRHDGTPPGTPGSGDNSRFYVKSIRSVGPPEVAEIGNFRDDSPTGGRRSTLIPVPPVNRNTRRTPQGSPHRDGISTRDGTSQDGRRSR